VKPAQRIIDLTLTMRPGMRGVDMEPKHQMPRDAWNSTQMHIFSHSGTHMDAPVHFGVGDAGIDAIALERLLRPAWIVRIENVRPRQLLCPEHLGDIRTRLQEGEGLLLNTGWARFAGDSSIYRDQLPRVSDEFARWCVERRVNLLGVEPPSVADVNDREEIQRIHRILLGGDVLVVEGLTNLEALTGNKVLFGAFPLKIEKGDGSPCRAFAIEGE
jgi:arylformamidase